MVRFVSVEKVPNMLEEVYLSGSGGHAGSCVWVPFLLSAGTVLAHLGIVALVELTDVQNTSVQIVLGHCSSANLDCLSFTESTEDCWGTISLCLDNGSWGKVLREIKTCVRKSSDWNSVLSVLSSWINNLSLINSLLNILQVN